MFEFVGKSLRAAVGLIDVRAKLLLRHVERAAAAMLWKAIAGACLGAAVLVGIAAGAVALAPEWGWPAVLGAGAAVLAAMGGVAWGVAASLGGPSKHPDPDAEELERQARQWSEVLQPEAPDEVAEPAASSPGRSPMGGLEESIKAVQRSVKDPVMIASAAFAIIALLGPVRALRTAAKVAAAASAARSVTRAVREAQGSRRS